jgi:trk system potassium uptake protein
VPKSLKHPARLVPIAFLIVVAVGTGLLMLPFARAGGGGAPFITALFTATSAVCVTGLIVQDTATYWSAFGHVVILALIQIGGFGIMSGATLLSMLVTRRLRLSTRLSAQAETRGLALGDVTAVLRLVVTVALVVQSVLAMTLALRLRFGHGESWADALWNGVFHAISAFNNAGFSTYSEGMMRFTHDPVILLPIMLGVLLGGIGMPVLHDMRRAPRQPARWSLHTKITLLGSALLLPTGLVATLLYEWSNPATIGEFEPAARVMHAAFHSVMMRSGGFNAVDIGQMRDQTLGVTYALMLIGGGSAGTAGGIKVGTFVIMLLIIMAEVRGEPDSVAFGRRVSPEVQRQAVTIVLLAVGMVGLGTLLLLSITGMHLRDALFETISAFATVGLSTGVTPQLPPAGQALLIALMFVGRVGTITVAAALALRARRNPYRYPEERPIVG